MLNHKGTKTLVTNRLVLRKFREGDAESMFNNWCSDNKVAKFTTWYAHNSIEDTKAFLKFLLTQNISEKNYNWAIEMNGELIGSINVCEIDEDTDLCGIAYCLGYDYWRKGIITEGCKTVIGFLFNEINCRRIIASYDSLNIGSGEVMRKIGMSHEGTLREHILRKDGSFGDIELYGILKKDYQLKNSVG